MSDKRPCSGLFCMMQRNFKCENCKLYDDCPQYTPTPQFSNLDSVIDIAMRNFDIDEKRRNELKILFNIYTTQYIAINYRLVGNFNGT